MAERGRQIRRRTIWRMAGSRRLGPTTRQRYHLVLRLLGLGGLALTLLATNALSDLLPAQVLLGDALDLVVLPVPLRAHHVARPPVNALVLAVLAVVIASQVLNLVDLLAL